MTRAAKIRSTGWQKAIPDALTDELVKHLMAHPTGERFVVVDGEGARALPGFVVRVGVEGVASFTVRYRVALTGAREEYRLATATGANTAQGRQEAKRILGLVAGGRNPAAEKREKREKRETVEKVKEARRGKLTLAKFITRYHEQRLAPMKSGQATLARLRSVWAPLLSKPLDEITKADAAEVLTDLLARGVKPSTGKTEWAHLRSMMA